MGGFIKDEHMQAAEQEFPGITHLLAALRAADKAPRTFLDLVWAYEEAAQKN